MSKGPPITFRPGSCLDVFGAEPDASFDCFVSDWPAGVAFMSRAWDRDHGGREAWVRVWAENARTMRAKAKPGAYSLTWALPRTAHWTACALEDGGWVIQDVIVHVFGQGWPKGKAALKPASEHWILAKNGSGGALQIDAARVERGEPRRLVTRGQSVNTYGAANGATFTTHEGGSWPPNFVLSHCPECEERGTRRVKGEKPRTLSNAAGCGYGGSAAFESSTVGGAPDGSESVPAFDCLAACDCGLSLLSTSGGAAPRCACGAAMWWACPVAEMDGQSGERRSTLTGRADPTVSHAHPGTARPASFFGLMDGGVGDVYADSGGASRFFPRFTYQAKAAGGERHAGCDGLYWRADKRSPFGFVRVSREEWAEIGGGNVATAYGQDQREHAPAKTMGARGNVHPTVKNLALMEWLVSLVCPPGGRVGDVTAGSGGTGIAVARLNVSKALGASFLGCDICPEAVEIADARLAWWRANTAVQEGLFGGVTVIEPEPKKERAVQVAPPSPKPPPPGDPRQKGLFE